MNEEELELEENEDVAVIAPVALGNGDWALDSACLGRAESGEGLYEYTAVNTVTGAKRSLGSNAELANAAVITYNNTDALLKRYRK